MILLTRDNFRESVFKRDKHKCVICGEPAVDAHHIIERKLFDNGGYYIDNGVSLCEKDHILAENCKISCDELRTRAGINTIILPEHFDTDVTYDKWGNIILSTGQRLKGEMFFEEQVQKVLKESGIISEFSKYIKYPRTYHLPWSEKLSNDDKKLPSIDHFIGKEIIATVKMDGENTTMYDDHIHAKSVNSDHHPSRSLVKQLWSEIAYQLPEGWRICGENMYARHTIHYHNLKSYFYVYSIWNEKNEAMSWDETVEYCAMLNLEPMPVIYRGIFDEKILRNLHKKQFDGDDCEGYVIRTVDGFKYNDFRKCVGKFVAEQFIIADNKHWMQQKVVPNELVKSV